jgi:hypothetical protein
VTAVSVWCEVDERGAEAMIGLLARLGVRVCTAQPVKGERMVWIELEHRRFPAHWSGKEVDVMLTSTLHELPSTGFDEVAPGIQLVKFVPRTSTPASSGA